jgi:hypothetical protein
LPESPELDGMSFAQQPIEKLVSRRLVALVAKAVAA